MKLDIFTAPNRDSLHWTPGTITWDELAEWLDSPADKKACGNYVLGRFRETSEVHKNKGKKDQPPCLDFHRNKVAVIDRCALTLDVDTPDPDFLVDAVMMLDYGFMLHTTYSSTREKPRYRLIIPLDRTIAPDEYYTAASAVMQLLGEHQFDPGSVQPERYMFKPSTQDADTYVKMVQPGRPAPADKLLEDFQEDLSALPAPKVGRNKRDPFAIEGTIGAFNRAYEDIQELITEYSLPYESVGTDRWQLAGSAAAAGMGYVQPGLVFSHHSNDPAYGVACSAFDLARLHLYGNLDEGVKDGTPVNRLPSHTAMLETATQDLRVVQELVGKDFDSDMDAVADSITQDNWRLGFSLNSRTGKPNDDIANWDLIANNDPAFTMLYWNELSLSIEARGDLPWRKVTDATRIVGTKDRSALALYVEREYGLRAARSYLDDLMNERALSRMVNPVRDYLESLRWDGKSRIETCLPGVKPTEFTRLAARKSLVAAAARMLEPGIKWDHMLVLYGTEGLGKSWWIDKMSRGYSSSLGRLNDKDTLITMQRSWIMTSDEGHSMKKADFDATKEFLTKTSDMIRLPYEKEVQEHKRHCVIWGTTNDETFLRRQEGNRRFLIVRAEEKVDFSLLTDAYIDQVWAEAVHLYRQGEQLFLDTDEEELAAEEREVFTEENALAGIIQEYVDTYVPDDWDTMSPETRAEWLMNSADGFTSAAGESQINTVCSLQIWVEALGRRRGDHRRIDLLEINEELKRLPGWVELPGRKRLPGYGPQKAFQRISTMEGGDLL